MRSSLGKLRELISFTIHVLRDIFRGPSGGEPEVLTAMLHLVSCPFCREKFKIYCNNVRNPFHRIQADQIVRLLNAPPVEPIDTPSSETVSYLKLLFLFDMIGEDFGDIRKMPKLSPQMTNYINHASSPIVKQILIEAVNRWDLLQSPPPSQNN